MFDNRTIKIVAGVEKLGGSSFDIELKAHVEHGLPGVIPDDNCYRGKIAGAQSVAGNISKRLYGVSFRIFYRVKFFTFFVGKGMIGASEVKEVSRHDDGL